MSVIIQAGLVGVQYPLDHPRVGWAARPGTATASSADAGFPATAAQDPRTITAWRPTSLPATWTLTFPADQTLTYVGIAAHDLGSSGCGVGLQVPDGVGGWSFLRGTRTQPTNDGAMMFLLVPVTTSAIRVRITDPGSATLPTIGHIRAGLVVEFPRRAQFTGLPITEARQIEYAFNQSQTGEWVGQTIKRRGLSFDVTVNNLSEDWTEGPYAPFRDHADTGQPFFYAARPVKYPEEVAYCMASDMIMSERTIGNRNISRSLTMRLRGYARNG